MVPAGFDRKAMGLAAITYRKAPMGRLLKLTLVVVCCASSLIPSVSASVPTRANVITMHAPFAIYGGQDVGGYGRRGPWWKGSYGNAILGGPAFNGTSGSLNDSISTGSGWGGIAWLDAWAGVSNLSFACSAGCVSGAHDVSVQWNLSWAAWAKSNCSYYYPSGDWARASVDVVASVVNVTTGSPVTLASRSVTTFRATLGHPAYFLNLTGTKVAKLKVSAVLFSPGSYQVDTSVYLRVWAHSEGGCGSAIWAALSPPTRSWVVLLPTANSRLVSIRIR